MDGALAEFEARGLATGLDPAQLRTIYLGGGTPSKLGGPGIAELLARLAQRIGVQKLSTSPDVHEITIEVNPEDVTEAAAREWAVAGVNRASVGVQSFNPEVLRWMHRDHSPEQSVFAVRTLRAAGIREISVDLIFALPSGWGGVATAERLAQTDRDWSADLEQAIALDPDHISLYGLTVEPSAPLGKWVARGEVVEAPEERYEAEFMEAHQRLAAAGFAHYEVSNYARAGKRARHNSAYWTGVPYLGLGPSAHGFDGRVRSWNVPTYTAWLEKVQAREDPTLGNEVIGPSERVAEGVYLGLRTINGLELRPGEEKVVVPWVDAGWGTLSADGRRLSLTALGWLRLDSLAATLTSLRSPS